MRKKDGKYRFCIDFRKVNAVTKKDAYPLPYINAMLDKLREAKYISSIDLKGGYWQVPLSPESKQITAFTVPSRGLFQFTVMPFARCARCCKRSCSPASTTKKKIPWTWAAEQQTAFQKLKDCLTSAPVLVCPDFSRPFVLQTDASDAGWSAALLQNYPNGDHVISYASRSLSTPKKGYSVT